MTFDEYKTTVVETRDNGETNDVPKQTENVDNEIDYSKYDEMIKQLKGET